MTSINQLKPIETETEHEIILKEIERLFDAKPGRSQAEKLENLLLLVESYEKEHYSLPQLSLIARFLYKLESRGLFPKWVSK